MKYDRKYSCIQLALKLTDTSFCYIGPVRNRSTNHWYLVEVLFPESESVTVDDRKANGMAEITDFCPQPITNVSPEYYATMWYANFFGMFLNNSRIVNNPKILSNVSDMDPMEFDTEDNSNSNDQEEITTLNHQSTHVTHPRSDSKNKPYHFHPLIPQCT